MVSHLMQQFTVNFTPARVNYKWSSLVYRRNNVLITEMNCGPTFSSLVAILHTLVFIHVPYYEANWKVYKRNDENWDLYPKFLYNVWKMIICLNLCRHFYIIMQFWFLMKLRCKGALIYLSVTLGCFYLQALTETEQLSPQSGPQDIYSDKCHTSPAVFGFFKAWKCSESGYQRIMGYCARFLAVTNHQKPNQISDISQKLLVSKVIVLREKGSFDAKSGACCLIEFASYKGILSQALSNSKAAISLGCNMAIVVRNSVDNLGYSTRKKKRSVLWKMDSVNAHQLNVTDAILENSSVRFTRGATNSSVWKTSSKLNETELKKIRERLAIRLWVYI